MTTTPTAGRRIWRQTVDRADRQTLTAPGLVRVLSVSSERGVLEAWFEVIPGEPGRSIDLIVVGTGHEIPADAACYVGTDIPAGGTFVWHFYTTETQEATR